MVVGGVGLSRRTPRCLCVLVTLGMSLTLSEASAFWHINELMGKGSKRTTFFRHIVSTETTADQIIKIFRCLLICMLK